MVESTALEMRHTRKGIAGSNPALSAKTHDFFSRLSGGASANAEPDGSLTMTKGDWLAVPAAPFSSSWRSCSATFSAMVTRGDDGRHPLALARLARVDLAPSSVSAGGGDAAVTRSLLRWAALVAAAAPRHQSRLLD